MNEIGVVFVGRHLDVVFELGMADLSNGGLDFGCIELLVGFFRLLFHFELIFVIFD